MTQDPKNGPYLWHEADNGILTVEAGCTVVMWSWLIHYAGLAGWSVEESWADLVWSGLAKPVSSNGLSETRGLVWSGLAKSSDLDPGGSLVGWSARENWIDLPQVETKMIG